MPPRKFSRHTFTTGFKDTSGPAEVADRIQLTDREPFTYRNLSDNVHHTVLEGENLFNLAARYFDGVDSPAQLWWVIADFQPDPILDPTIALIPGQVVVIPSLRTVIESVFSESRRVRGTP